MHERGAYATGGFPGVCLMTSNMYERVLRTKVHHAMGRGPRCKVPNEVQHAGEGFKVQNPKHTIQMGDGQRSGVQHVWEVFKVQGQHMLAKV